MSKKQAGAEHSPVSTEQGNAALSSATSETYSQSRQERKARAVIAREKRLTAGQKRLSQLMLEAEDQDLPSPDHFRFVNPLRPMHEDDCTKEVDRTRREIWAAEVEHLRLDPRADDLYVTEADEVDK